MKNDFAKIATKTFGLLCVLLALAAWGATLPNQGRMEYVHELIDHAREERVAQPREGGYYQILMRPAKGQGVLRHTPIEFLTLSKIVRTAAQADDIYQFNSFRIYEPKPNLDFPNSVEGPVQTNSFGLFDRERSLEKQPGVRRIAVFGDSVIRGYGVTLDERFTSVLEARLNSGHGEKVEIINFAVPAYNLTQTFDVVMEKAPAFHPDVYVLAMTDITGARTLWADPFIQIVQDKQNLKYDFLRDLAKQSDITSEDSKELGRWKLAPYRESIMRELLLKIKAHAEQQQAKLVVFLVPSAQDQNIVDDGFAPLRQCLQGTGIPVVDASQTFKGTDLDNLRVSWHDLHPSAEGHKLIGENLYNKLYENPEAWKALTGISRNASSSGQ